MAAASVRAGFETLGLADLVCFTLVTNRASQHVMQKVGFKFEREVEYAGLPHLLYRLAATEWLDAAPR
jgi:RimJ/RimL family protein N-acetyltransferase